MKRVYESSLLEWRDKPRRLPLLLKGARQVGKTHLIQTFGRDHFANLHYFNFEKNPDLNEIFSVQLEPNKIITKLELWSEKSIDAKKDLLFFDEIQACPRALNSFKYFAEERPDLAIVGAGSLLGVHLQTEPFPVGKVEFLKIYPLTFFEFLESRNQMQLVTEFLKEPASWIHDRLWDQWKNYLITGGLPAVVRHFNETSLDWLKCMGQIRDRQESIFGSYVSDMAKHSGKVNAMHLERLLMNIPAQLGRPQSGRFQFKSVVPNKSRYAELTDCIDWLQAAGLIFRVPIVNNASIPLTAYTKENIFKLYVFDVGMLTYMSNLSPASIAQTNYGTYKGFVAENFVIQEIIAHGRTTPIYNWIEKESELDFVTELDGMIYPIEVKSGENLRSRSLSVFQKKYNPKKVLRMSGAFPKASFTNQWTDEQRIVCDLPIYLAGSLFA